MKAEANPALNIHPLALTIFETVHQVAQAGLKLV